FLLKTRFKASCAVAVIARPILGPVQIAAAAARVGILNLQELEILFPVRTLFLERREAVTNFNPLHRSILEFSGFPHVSQILVTCDISSPKRSIFDRVVEGLFLARSDFRSDEISHRYILFKRIPPLWVVALISGPPAPTLKLRFESSSRPRTLTGKSEFTRP